MMTKSRKINVLHLRSCRGGGGGPEKTIMFSVREVDASAFHMSIAYLKSANDPQFDLDERAKNLGIEEFYTIDESWKFDLAALRKLLRLLREKQIDILHCHCYKSDLYGLILSRYHKMKLVTTAHGPLATFQFFWASKNWRVRYLYDQLDLRILRYFDAVIMVSDTMRDIISKYRVDPQRLIWIRNAIDSKHFRRRENPDPHFRESLGIPPQAKVVGAVGRLNGEKDYPNFLHAAKALLAICDDLHFVIVGKGELDEELRRLATDLGLTDRVHFLGHFHDVRQVYELLDVYVLSSTREGLPNTVLEAMAMEVPIVSTDVDGVKEAVQHDRDAILVPARDSHALATAIDNVLNDAALQQRLVQSARERVESQFSFSTRIRKIEQIYYAVMADEKVAALATPRVMMGGT